MAGDPKKVTLRAVDENYVGPDTTLRNVAASIKEGRKREREESAVAWAKREGEHAGQLQGQATAHKAELARAERLHGKAHYWQGAAIMGMVGLAVGSTIASLIFLASMRESFTNARDYGASMVATGAAQQMVNPPERCIPGETLSDGRVCPQRQ